jgi:acetyl-CoA synthetase
MHVRTHSLIFISIQFAGFSADSFAERMLDSRCKVLVTTDGAWRGQKLLCLKEICDAGRAS